MNPDELAQICIDHYRHQAKGKGVQRKNEWTVLCGIVEEDIPEKQERDSDSVIKRQRKENCYKVVSMA
jgi:hypothetical protein